MVILILVYNNNSVETRTDNTFSVVKDPKNLDLAKSILDGLSLSQ